MINLRASFLIALVVASIAQGAPRRDVLTHASEGRYWVVQIVPPGTSVSYVRTAIRMREASSATWQLVTTLRGRAVGAAHLNNNLALLMDDSSWLLAWPGGTSTGPRLPDAAIMREIAGDAQSLWALGVRTELPQESRPASSRLLSYVFENGAWQPRGAAPAEIGHDRPVSMAVFDGRPMIAWLNSPREVYFTQMNRDGNFTDIERIATDFNVEDFHLFDDRTSTPTLWLAAEGSIGELRTRRQTWRAPTPLRESKLPAGAVHRVAEFFAGNVRIVALDEGRLLEQAFTLDGLAVGEVQDLGRTPKPHAAPISGWSLLLMALSAMLLSAAVFRNEEGEPLVFGKERRVLAPLPRRITAGLIDLAPLIALAIWTLPWGDEKTIGGSLTTEQFLTRMIAAMSIYIAHTTLLELATGRSIGKLLCRLRVVTLEGETPSRSSILIRNAVRVVDVLPALPLAILVLFSPLRQRLGDVLARTIVVMDAPAPDEPRA